MGRLEEANGAALTRLRGIRGGVAATLWGIACMAASVMAAERQPTPIQNGRRSFEAYCSSCHGRSATGNGTRKGMNPAPADLTTIARRTGGVFPEDDVAAHIDGRVEVELHGPRAMPVWGETNLTRPMITDIVAYLKTLQRK